MKKEAKHIPKHLVETTEQQQYQYCGIARVKFEMPISAEVWLAVMHTNL